MTVTPPALARPASPRSGVSIVAPAAAASAAAAAASGSNVGALPP
jgi:hypothetical protein